jgi:hypothetical protein
MEAIMLSRKMSSEMAFTSTPADNRRMMVGIEPLSQSGRDNFQTPAFQTDERPSRVNFCSPRISVG